MRLSRRRLLASTLPLGGLLLAACDIVPSARSVPTVPAGPVEVRVVRAGVEDVAWAAGQVQAAANRIDHFQQNRLIFQSLVPVETARGLAGDSVTTPVTDPLMWPEVYGAMLGQLSRAEAPDLVLTDWLRVSALGRADALRDLSPILRGERWFEDLEFRNNLLRSGQVRGKLLALPLLIGAEMMFYHSQSFQTEGVPLPQAGWTWSDFRQAARALTRPGAARHGDRWGAFISGYWPSIWTMAWQ